MILSIKSKRGHVMSEYIFMSRGSEDDYDEFMDLINLTFGFEDESVQFLGLLPKLYKKEFKPVENNVVLKVNDEMRSAVGLFYNEMDVLGHKLLCGGIGNVAVHPEHRGKGYMKAVMAYCLDEMKQKMCDFSFLGGQRQRYEYFSYQPGGISIKCEFSKTNVRHLFGINHTPEFTAKEITSPDDPAVKKIEILHAASPCKMKRDSGKYFDIIKSWRHKPYGVYDRYGDFKGYFIVTENKKWITEFKAVDDNEIKFVAEAMIIACESETLTVNLPEFEKANCEFFEKYGEYISYNNVDMISVFNFEKTVRAFLTLKASYAPLADGSFTALILGEKMPEKIKITVRDGIVSVEESNEKEDITLSHDEAMKLFFGLYSPKRFELPSGCSGWFPLPLYIYQPDNV